MFPQDDEIQQELLRQEELSEFQRESDAWCKLMLDEADESYYIEKDMEVQLESERLAMLHDDDQYSDYHDYYDLGDVGEDPSCGW